MRVSKLMFRPPLVIVGVTAGKAEVILEYKLAADAVATLSMYSASDVALATILKNAEEAVLIMMSASLLWATTTWGFYART